MSVPQGDPLESLGVEGVQDTFMRSSPAADNPAARRARPIAFVVNEMSGAAERRGGRDDADQPGRRSGSPPVNSHLTDTELFHPDGDEPHDFVVAENLVLRQPVQTFGRHAIGAAKIAPVGQRDPQIGGHSAVRIGEDARRERQGGHQFSLGAVRTRCSSRVERAPCGMLDG